MAKSLKEKLTNLKIWRSSGAEFVGTSFLVLLMCGINSQTWILLESDSSAVSVYILHSAVYALSVMSICWSIQHVSGGHINPAITVASLVIRKISIIRAIFYILAQSAASVLAAGLMYGATGKNNLQVFKPHESLNMWQATGVELLMTFLYSFVFFACLDKSKCKEGNNANLGGAVFVASLFAIPFTGACFNPARLLGPALVLNEWDLHWIYWAGPAVGAALAGLLYDIFFASNASVQRVINCGTSCSYDSDRKATKETYKIHQGERERLRPHEKPSKKTEEV